MVSSIGNLNGAALANFLSSPVSSLSFSTASKLYVPVSPSMVIYSQFEHVSGVAAKNGQGGVNITKITILNTLIDRLVEMKQKPEPVKNTEVLNDTQVDALIKDYQNRIQNLIGTAVGNPYAISGAEMPQTGVLFSIAA